MTDRFADRAGSLTAPASIAFAITPSDSEALAQTTRALYVGGAGDVVVTFAAGQIVTFAAVPAGTILPVRVTAVRAATTATQIVGLA